MRHNVVRSNLATYQNNEMLKWNSTLFNLSLIIEGTTEKVWKVIMSLKSTQNRNFYYNELKCMFEHCKKVKIKSQYYDSICSVYLFRAALYELIFAFHKIFCFLILWKCLVGICIDIQSSTFKNLMFGWVDKPYLSF